MWACSCSYLHGLSWEQPIFVHSQQLINNRLQKTEWEQWVTLLSDVPLCCCCLSLQVVSYHACVCGLFILTCYIHCVSVLSKPSKCCVCAVLYAYLFIFSLLLCFVVFLQPLQTSALANSSTHCKDYVSRNEPFLQMHKHACGRRPKRPARQTLIKPKLLMEMECSAKCWSFQGPRSLGSVEPSGLRDSSPGNMPRWNKPIFGPVSLPYLSVFQLNKVLFKQCCWRVMDLKYYSLA